MVATQALGEKAALDGFWYSISQSLSNALYFGEEHPYVLVAVAIVFGYFLLRKR